MQRKSWRELLADKLLPLVTTSISISAVLIAVDMFNERPSLELGRLGHGSIEYHPERWIDFYDNIVWRCQRM